jgi:hypothetical protein
MEFYDDRSKGYNIVVNDTIFENDDVKLCKTEDGEYLLY